jgi:hypothetical protein
LAVTVALRTYQLVEPKTPNSRRTIAIPEIALTALKSHRSRQAEEKLAAGFCLKASSKQQLTLLELR